MKKWMRMLGVLMLLCLSGCGPEAEMEDTASEEMTTKEWSPDSLREGHLTAIAYDKTYNALVESKERAQEVIRDYGVKQRKLYDNPEVETLELQMEEEYHILAVTLGEVELATAQDIKRACDYMFSTYPVLKGNLTNLTLGNFESAKMSHIALTESREFIINEEYGVYPFVVKLEIILNAGKFMNREELLKDCDNLVDTGYWPENADISSIVVHELGHQLLNVVVMKEFGFTDAYYITEENGDAYSRYVTNMLSVNQTVEKAVIEEAYEIWQQEYGQEGTQEEFRASISGYAKGEQEDGGISYSETVAEAIADIYLNGDDAADASKAIEEVLFNMLAD